VALRFYFSGGGYEDIEFVDISSQNATFGEVYFGQFFCCDVGLATPLVGISFVASAGADTRVYMLPGDPKNMVVC
jgi:hypothetical protein